jgi:hypothetical protein
MILFSNAVFHQRIIFKYINTRSFTSNKMLNLLGHYLGRFDLFTLNVVILKFILLNI